MKFYYQGHLIRTSKTHNYKYAIIDKETFKAYRCSKDLKGIQSGLHEIRRNLDVLLSVQNGTYIQKPRCCTAKEIENNKIKYYGSLQNAIDKEKEYVNSFIVVELEIK